MDWNLHLRKSFVSIASIWQDEMQNELTCTTSVKSIRKCKNSLYNQPKPYFIEKLL
jgi:hypothetical protein